MHVTLPKIDLGITSFFVDNQNNSSRACRATEGQLEYLAVYIYAVSLHLWYTNRETRCMQVVLVIKFPQYHHDQVRVSNQKPNRQKAPICSIVNKLWDRKPNLSTLKIVNFQNSRVRAWKVFNCYLLAIRRSTLLFQAGVEWIAWSRYQVMYTPR